MHTVGEVPAVKRSTYIGLLVLAFAITAVGMGIIYLAFLPASATQAAVETVSYPIEILTDIVKPDSITVDFDGYARSAWGQQLSPNRTLEPRAIPKMSSLPARQPVYSKARRLSVVRRRNISSQERPNEWRVLFDPWKLMRQTGADCATSHTTPAAWTMKDRGSISRMAT